VISNWCQLSSYLIVVGKMPKKSLRCIVEININSVSVIFVRIDIKNRVEVVKIASQTEIEYYGMNVMPKKLNWIKFKKNIRILLCVLKYDK